MTYLYGHHKVRDFDTWKPYFDNDDARRQEAGVHLVNLFQSTKDPNEVHFLFTVDDPKVMQEMMESEDMEKKMKEAGVLSEPQIYVLKSV